MHSSSENELLSKTAPNLRRLYFILKDLVLNLSDDISMETMKHQIAFYKGRKGHSKRDCGLVWFTPHKNSIDIYLRKGEYSDKNLKRLDSDRGYKGYYLIKVTGHGEKESERLRKLLSEAYQNFSCRPTDFIQK